MVAYGRASVTEDARPSLPPRAKARCASTLPAASTPSTRPRRERPLGQLLYETCAQLLNYPDQPGAAGTDWCRGRRGAAHDLARRPHLRLHDRRASASRHGRAPVTARTFKATIERTLDLRMHSAIATELSNIAGARVYMQADRPTCLASAPAATGSRSGWSPPREICPRGSRSPRSAPSRPTRRTCRAACAGSRWQARTGSRTIPPARASSSPATPATTATGRGASPASSTRWG